MKNNRLKGATDYSEDTHLAIIKSLLEKRKKFTYTSLHRTIKDVALDNDIKIGTSKAKLFAKYYYQNEKYIIKKGVSVYFVKPV